MLTLHKMCPCRTKRVQIWLIKAHTAIPYVHYQAFLGKQAQRKHNNAATKENPLILKGSAGMKKRMKYDGTYKYNKILACLFYFFYGYLHFFVL